MLAKTDKYKTRKITDMFSAQPRELRAVEEDAEESAGADTSNTEMDMEDIGNDKTGRATIIRPVVHTMKR
ncbi:hypothetical protein NL445_29255, partial [Klebsiella pneumoniae]|nr:hypothetical protein [Klebsiella pneumoniae]